MISLTKQLFGKKKKLPVENKIEWVYPERFGDDVHLVITMGANTRVEPGDTLTIQMSPLNVFGEPFHDT